MQLTDPTLLNNSAFINGHWRQSENKETFTVNNPATGELITHVASLSSKEVEEAIFSAAPLFRFTDEEQAIKTP